MGHDLCDPIQRPPAITRGFGGAGAYAELLAPEPFNLTSFPNEADYDELVVVRDIPFQPLCMHHLLSFHGVAHVAYLPAERIAGLSKLARVVEHFAHELQLGARTVTSALHGLVCDDPRTREEFLSLTAVHGR